MRSSSIGLSAFLALAYERPPLGIRVSPLLAAVSVPTGARDRSPHPLEERLACLRSRVDRRGELLGKLGLIRLARSSGCEAVWLLASWFDAAVVCKSQLLMCGKVL